MNQQNSTPAVLDDNFLLPIQTKFLPLAREEKFTASKWEGFKALISKPIEFLRPPAMQSAKVWLTRTGLDDRAYLSGRRKQLFPVWIIYCFPATVCNCRLFLFVLSIWNLPTSKLGSREASSEDCIRDLDIGVLTAQRSPPTGALEDFVSFNADIEVTCHWYTACRWSFYYGG